MSGLDVKDQVRNFYDRIGWQMMCDGFYQNARYEDLRPVSAEYIKRCHLRVNRYIRNEGKYLLDAGCGPIQYPEYLSYSQKYNFRICLDISIIALKEARTRIGSHGLYVVADVANLPFRSDICEGAVSLHTLHHLPANEQVRAYSELYRVLKTGCRAVVVNGWTDSSLMRQSLWLVRLMERLGNRFQKQSSRKQPEKNEEDLACRASQRPPTGTYINKLDVRGLRQEVGTRMPLKIHVWRSVNVRFLRAVIHQGLGGKYFLRFLFWLEERFPVYFGEKGQYPLVVISK